jgi:glutaredoxin-like protein NrdH
MTPREAPDLIVYSTPFCAPCERLKLYLRERGVEFVVRDPLVDEEAADFLDGRGIGTTPVLRRGDQVVVGFQPGEVDALLGLSTEELT